MRFFSYVHTATILQNNMLFIAGDATDVLITHHTSHCLSCDLFVTCTQRLYETNNKTARVVRSSPCIVEGSNLRPSG